MLSTTCSRQHPEPHCSRLVPKARTRPRVECGCSCTEVDRIATSFVKHCSPGALCSTACCAPGKCSSVAPSGLGEHHVDELLVVDLPITIHICLTNHLLNLLFRELLAQVGHHVPELSSRDVAVAILIEHTEGLLQLVLVVCVLHLAGHEHEELWEIDGAVAISVHLVDHVLQLGLSGVLAQGAHDGAQLFRGDGAISVLVEQSEGLLEFGNLLLSQLGLIKLRGHLF
mmetsp:Transcript_17193/g.43122  ORF Transcript_17193/g.43122 Transcript_17193/m.43122 type:complete len:228 (+) Transcript_17193:318-1001(+)